MDALLLWIGLAVALSPSLVDLVGHWVAEPWARYSALFVPLSIACARRDASPCTPRADGYALTLLGVGICAVAVAGGMSRFGRPGIALAAVGLARVIGAPGLPCALLAAFVVPIPRALLDALPGLVELAGTGIAAASARGFELSARPVLEGIELAAPTGALHVGPEHGGLPLAALLSGLGWYAAVRRGASVRAAAATALCWAPWALVIQPLGLVVAAGLLVAGVPRAAGVLLEPGVTLAVVAVSLYRIHAHAPAGRSPRAGRPREARS